MGVVNCPICDEHIQFDSSPKLDQAILCDACGTLLVVVAIKPPVLDVAENISLTQPNQRKERKKIGKGRKGNDDNDDWDDWEDWDMFGYGASNKSRTVKPRKKKRGRRH
jgi:lysine biosynthesis protein LysW